MRFFSLWTLSVWVIRLLREIFIWPSLLLGAVILAALLHQYVVYEDIPEIRVLLTLLLPSGLVQRNPGRCPYRKRRKSQCYYTLAGGYAGRKGGAS
ncbi:hypothetical protein C7M51_02960 [Mixta intestinalis]|jgi:hypothetical protein|uniref:Uncharacterized protein n=1 Tax=Mixta intestinalis TaxID=1615494 RepID=A0A6P1Q2S3_9GAMM|nr:hypothetical protein C7M51_02960 [Mixta intestinalis]